MSHLLTRSLTIGAAAALLGASSLSGSAVAGISVHAAGRSTYTTWRVIYRTTHAALGPAATATGPRHVWVLASTASVNYVLRWNGSAWRKMPPLPSGFGAQVFRPFLIKASGPGNIWVFGNVSDPFTHPEAIVWDGRSWRPVTPQLPAIVSGGSVGDGDAVVVSPTDVWYADGASLFHWNGTAWVVTPFNAFDSSHDLAVPAAHARSAGAHAAGQGGAQAPAQRRRAAAPSRSAAAGGAPARPASPSRDRLTGHLVSHLSRACLARPPTPNLALYRTHARIYVPGNVTGMRPGAAEHGDPAPRRTAPAGSDAPS